MEQFPGEKKMENPIHFESGELCALDAAFEDPQNGSLLEDLRKQYPHAHIYEEGNKGSEMFKGVTRMSASFDEFPFLTSMIDIVEAEVQELETVTGVADLPCGHNALEHQQALESVAEKISRSFMKNTN